MVAVPNLCKAGVIARNRVAPAPLTSRLASGTSVWFEDLAVIETANRAESASLTLKTMFVASSSGIVTDDGSVMTGAAAKAVMLLKMTNNITHTTPGRRVAKVAGVLRCAPKFNVVVFIIPKTMFPVQTRAM